MRAAGAWLRAHPELSATLWLTSAGDDDRGGAVAALATTLKEVAPATLAWRFEPMPAEQHSTIYRAVAPIALREVFPPR